MKAKNFLLACFVLLFAICSCSKAQPFEQVKKKYPDPSRTSLIELWSDIQADWEENLQVKRIYIVAHRANTYRSARAGIPDNSLPNIEAAIEAGADMVELDVRTTKDGELVLMHNASIDETTEGVGKVGDLTLDQIKSYRMKKGKTVYKDEKGQYCHVPTLKEALLATKDRIYVNLDLAGKNNNNAKILSVIQECGVQDQVMLYFGSSSSDYDECQSINPLVAIHPYISEPSDIQKYQNYVGAGLYQYSNKAYLTGGYSGTFGTQCHALGALSYSNLLNEYDSQIINGDYSSLDKFISCGSDFIQTDVCELVDEYLVKQNLR